MEEKEAVKFISDTLTSSAEGISDIEPEFFRKQAEKYVKNLIKYHSSAMFLGRRKSIDFIDNAAVLYKLTSNISASNSSWIPSFEAFGAKREAVTGVRDVANKEFNFLVHGKTGSGKTAILQQIMLLSLSGQRIPVLIDLQEKAETSILDFIIASIVDTLCIGKFHKAASLVSKMLSNGEFIILCDGLKLDMCEELEDITFEYSKTRFIVTSRTAYKQSLMGFTNLEVRGFSEEQIKLFVNAWFNDKPENAELFLLKMSSACYESQKMCSVPLFLGMLCLVFSKNMDFPVNSADLCEASTALTLRTWHNNEKGSTLYRNISAKRKLDMFAKIAYRSFISSHRSLHRDDLESEVLDFIESMPKNDKLKPDLYEFIRTIESEHGILLNLEGRYCPFIQEYLVAKHIINSGVLLDKVKLASPAWREVFLLTASMLPDGHEFFINMQEYINSLSGGNEEILRWAEAKSQQAKVPYPIASVRAFYVAMNFYFLFPDLYECGCEVADLFGLSRCIDVDLTQEFNISRTGKFVIILNLDRELVSMVNELSTFVSAENYTVLTALHGKDYAKHIDERLGVWVNIALRLNEFDFIAELYAFKKRIPTADSKLEEWVKFRKDLKAAAIEYRNVCVDFEPHIRPYLYANKVLAECMKTECCIHPETRKNILAKSMAAV